VAGHVGFKLRNVVGNYPFASSHRSGGPAEFTPQRPLAFELQRRGSQLGAWVLPGSSASALQGRWPSFDVAKKARIDRDLFFRSEDHRPAAKPATPLLSLRWTFRAKRACVVITDADLTGLLLSARHADGLSSLFTLERTYPVQEHPVALEQAQRAIQKV
jgi:hypothetical protein